MCSFKLLFSKITWSLIPFQYDLLDLFSAINDLKFYNFLLLSLCKRLENDILKMIWYYVRWYKSLKDIYFPITAADTQQNEPRLKIYNKEDSLFPENYI